MPCRAADVAGFTLSNLLTPPGVSIFDDDFSSNRYSVTSRTPSSPFSRWLSKKSSNSRALRLLSS
jgi:hypothetical protein